MSLILKEKIPGSAAWRGQDLVDDNSWRLTLSDSAINTIDNALRSIIAQGLKFPGFSKADFPIDDMHDELQRFAVELEEGKGFFLLHGLPINRYTDDEIEIIYYGLGLHLGIPVCQNPGGDLLGKVMNVGDITNKGTRVYETNAYLPYHTDLADVFGLICVRKAKTGGLSSLVSSGAVYNEILQYYPEYLGLFYRPMFYAHLAEDSPGCAPIFSFHDGKLSCRYLRQYIELGHELQGQALSRIEIEALDLFDSIIHDKRIRLDMMLEPGDMVFANNYAVMHSRTSFEDYDEPELGRKLLRLWLKMPNARTLALIFRDVMDFHRPIEISAR